MRLRAHGHDADIAPAPGGARLPGGRAAPVVLETWGKLPYAVALERQLEYVDRRRRGVIPDTIVTVDHPPTVSLGRNAPETDVVGDAAGLAARGIDLVRSDRGGRTTYHGPGQVVVYPIVAVAERQLGVKRWVCLLEAALLDALAAHGIEGSRIAGSPGIWTAGSKIASVGLRIDRGISYHGVSLNVGLDVSGFDCIVTCGVAGQNVTSIAEQARATPSVEHVASTLSRAIAERLEAQPSDQL